MSMKFWKRQVQNQSSALVLESLLKTQYEKLKLVLAQWNPSLNIFTKIYMR